MSEDLKLYGHQKQGIRALIAGREQGHRAQILYMPTGGGKTETAAWMMKKRADDGKRAAILVDRDVLCEQTMRRLDKYGIDHGVVQGGHWRWRPAERIQVCMAQTLEKKGEFPAMDLLIVDECHNTRKQTVDFIKNNPQVEVIGLSASPFTKGLGSIYSNVVNAGTTEMLVGIGKLAPLRVFVAKQIDMTGAKKVAGEWSEAEAGRRGIELTGDIVAEWVAKTHQVFGGPRKTIVFAAGVAHGEDLVRKFADAGYNFASVSYNDDTAFKREAIEEFSKPDSSIQGLIATDILTKGFDVPDVMIGVSARPFTKSLASHVQQLGRVMRPSPGKEFALWLDHSGNYHRFLEDWEQIYAEGCSKLDDGRETAKAEPSDREKKEAKCPSCGSFMAPKADSCPHCGYVRVRRNGVVVLPGEMEELVRREQAARVAEQRFYSELLGYAEQHGYKPGWAYHKHQAKFGQPPRGLRDDAAMPSAATERWVRSQAIRWAKGRALGAGA